MKRRRKTPGLKKTVPSNSTDENTSQQTRESHEDIPSIKKNLRQTNNSKDEIVPKKRKGRPPKTTILQTIEIKKKRGRPKNEQKKNLVQSIQSTVNGMESLKDTKKTNTRGNIRSIRQIKSVISQMDNKDLQIEPKNIANNKKKIKPNTQKAKVDMVTCGKCKFVIQERLFEYHNIQVHNGLGWLEGADIPDYENDEKLLKKVLFIVIKKRKGQLACEKCQETKRSVLGYLSHIKFCGKTEEEKKALMYCCPICNALILPTSIDYHENVHHKSNLKSENYPAPESVSISIEETGRRKRRAAEKANSKILEITTEIKNDMSKSILNKSSESNKMMKKYIKKPQFEKQSSEILKEKWLEEINTTKNVKCSNVGCEYFTNSLDDIVNHYSKCNFVPDKRFTCKICRNKFISIEDIEKHIEELHLDQENGEKYEESSSDDSLSDFSENDESNEIKKIKSHSSKKSDSTHTVEKFSFLANLGDLNFHWTMPFTSSMNWDSEFKQNNFDFNSFSHLNSNIFTIVPENLQESYLPREKQSMLIEICEKGLENKKSIHYKQFKRFEGGSINDFPAFFAGGPIWALSWLPLPISRTDMREISQFIAVSCHQTMDDKFSIGKIYSGKNIIQLWHLGDLQIKSRSYDTPKLVYAIIHNGGTVNCLEWCPSGCYQDFEDKLNNGIRRMGLLASACSDGCIYIYSMKFPDDLPETVNDSSERILETEPAAILLVNTMLFNDKQQIWQATALHWTKEKKHEVIVAGFSNGYIGLWNLNSQSSLLTKKKGNTIYFNPYKFFLAHHHTITTKNSTVIHIVPFGGKRYIASASYDRTYKFWDLEDLSNSKCNSTKSFVTGGAWFNNWMCAILAFDDSLNLKNNSSSLIPTREYSYKYYNYLYSNSPCYAIATSDICNAIAQGNLAGELLVTFPQQLLYLQQMSLSLPKKRLESMISRIDSRELSKEKSFKQNTHDLSGGKDCVPTTYEDCVNRLALNFIDFIDKNQPHSKNSRGSEVKKTLTRDIMKSPSVYQYPYASINKLSWNPNATTSLWLAAGYQNGIIRLIEFRSMKNSFYLKN